MFETVQRQTLDLVPYDDNPRNISHERLAALKRSLEADPEMLQARPLLALPDGRVIAGNQRLRAATELGWPTVPCVTVDLDEQRAKLWALRDNNQYGHWDEDQLSFMLQELNASGADLDLAGFEPGFLDEMLREVNGGATDPDEAPPVPAEPKSERGVVYELGAHRLMCGDATSAEDLDALMDGESEDVIVTDPPYGVNVEYGVFHDSMENVWTLIEAITPRILAAPVAVLTSGHRAMWRYPAPDWVLAWVHPAGNGQGAWGFTCFHPILAYGKDPYLARGRGSRPDTIVSTSDREGVTGHPVVKPMEVWEWLVDRVTPDHGALVLDPLAGAGTTLIAAERLGRRCYAMEIDPAYCDVTRQRYADYTNQPHLAP